MKQRAAFGILIVLTVFLLSCSVFAEGSYLLCEKDGFVAVQVNRDHSWLCITDTPLRLLPEADRKAVQAGMIFGSLSEVTKVLEDLCS